MSERSTPDHYSKRAKKEGYPARSIYKLEEIQKKFNLIKTGNHILDVGAAPGSWSMYALKLIGSKGLVCAVDLKELNFPKQPDNYFFIQGDAFAPENIEIIKQKGPFNVIISDAAPDTTGSRSVDTLRSSSLVESVIMLTETLLVPGGNFAVKIFQCGEERAIIDNLKKSFDMVKSFKPTACRKESFETFIVGIGKK